MRKKTTYCDIILATLNNFVSDLFHNVVILFSLGSSKNDVPVLGGEGQLFCDDSTKVLVIKLVTMGEGVENYVTSIYPSLTDYLTKFDLSFNP